MLRRSWWTERPKSGVAALMGKETGQSLNLKGTEGWGPVLKQCVEPGSCTSTAFQWLYSALVLVGFRQHQLVTKKSPLPVKIMPSGLMLMAV